MNIAGQINGYNWTGANTTHGLLAANTGTAITVTAARYGSRERERNVGQLGFRHKILRRHPRFDDRDRGRGLLGRQYPVAAAAYARLSGPRVVQRALPRPTRRARRQYDPAVHARHIALNARLRSGSNPAHRRKFGGNLELFPSISPRSASTVSGSAGSPSPRLLPTAPHSPPPNGWQPFRTGNSAAQMGLNLRMPFRSPGRAAFASRKPTPPASSPRTGARNPASIRNTSPTRPAF